MPGENDPAKTATGDTLMKWGVRAAGVAIAAVGYVVLAPRISLLANVSLAVAMLILGVVVAYLTRSKAAGLPHRLAQGAAFGGASLLLLPLVINAATGLAGNVGGTGKPEAGVDRSAVVQGQRDLWGSS